MKFFLETSLKATKFAALHLMSYVNFKHWAIVFFYAQLETAGDTNSITFLLILLTSILVFILSN